MTLPPACPVTICIPSNRPLALARGPLQSAIDFAAVRNYRVVISDNSGEGAKLAFFSNVPGHVTYLFDASLGPAANLMACLDAADTDFILPMGDDDYLETVPGQTSFDFSTLGPDIAGVRPTLDVFAVGEGVLRSHNFSITAETAAERLYEYRQKVAGDNALYYSYFRRDDFHELVRLLANHPLAAGDMDWALVYSLVSNGKILHDPSTYVRYDIGKWRWKEGIEAAVQAIYETAGLPKEAIAFEHLFRFLDTYVFAFRRTSRLGDIERIKLLYAATVIFLGHTLHTSETQPQRFIGFEREVASLRAVLKEPDDYLVNVFDAAARVADRLKPGLYEQYVHWFASVQSDGSAE